MKRKSIAGLTVIAIVAIVSVVAFSGCIEKEEAPTPEIPAETSPEVTEPGEEPGIAQPSEEREQEIVLEKYDGRFFRSTNQKDGIYTLLELAVSLLF